jgi:O-antigen ligase
MQCRNCGTEIADKAIVCYRCGHATTDPVRRPAKVQPRRPPLAAFVVVAALALLSIYLFQLSRTAADPQLPQLASGLCAGAAVAVLFLGVLRRRR